MTTITLTTNFSCFENGVNTLILINNTKTMLLLSVHCYQVKLGDRTTRQEELFVSKKDAVQAIICDWGTKLPRGK